MRTVEGVGIVGYGAYIPMYRLRASEVNRVWGGSGAPVEEKSVVSMDEDAVTISVECARYAVRRAGIDPREIGAVYVGTESKPYAVKPSGTIVAEAIGATPDCTAADYEFACKAGTEAFQTCIGLVSSGMVKYAMAIGADTAQGRPADALEYTAACGGAAYIFGKRPSRTLADLEGSYSYVTDTPDFWRRGREMYPRHGSRFTGEPAYFKHVIGAAKGLMGELGSEPGDYDYAIFHQPNTKFPIKAARALGFSMDSIKPGLVVPFVGNTYAGSTPLGLAATLDVAEPGDRILAVSYGSGAGSDAFSFIVQDAITNERRLDPAVRRFVTRKRYIDYSVYSKLRGKLLK
ncbi:MAG: hydroxymethylglutaryl-CoA synthase [Candidatus Bathyarchaeota archaeon]